MTTDRIFIKVGSKEVGSQMFQTQILHNQKIYLLTHVEVDEVEVVRSP